MSQSSRQQPTEDELRQERRRRVLSVGGVLLVLVLVVIGGFILNTVRDPTKNIAKDAPAIGSRYGVTIGPDSAPHRIVVYEDFLCPFCGRFEEHTHAELAALAAQGKVQVEYRPFNYLDRDYSVRSAAAFAVVLDQAGPVVAKKFHDLLFASQPDEGGPYLSNAELVALAARAGATSATIKADVDDESGKPWVTAATKTAIDVGVGVNGTPTIILDGKLFNDGRTVEDIAKNVLSAVQ